MTARQNEIKFAIGVPVKLQKLSFLIPVLMLPIGLWLGYRTFRDYGWADIMASLTGIPGLDIGLALLCVAASYLCLTGFDALAIRHVGRSLPYGKVALTSFVSLSIGHNVGVAALSSGTLRYRFYSGFGLRAVEVGEIILFCGLTVGVGLISLGGLVLLLTPEIGGEMIGIAPTTARALGVLCLMLTAAYVLISWRVRKPLRIRGHPFHLPTPGIALAQIAVGTVNFAFVAATLHQLLTRAAAYAEVVAAYVLGNVAALMSHVPGGLGVLEYVIGSLVGHGEVVGALIVFRLIYFLLPLVLGSALLAGAEIGRWRRR